MRKIILILCLVGFCSGSAYGGQVFSTVDEIGEQVCKLTGIKSTTLLADSILHDFVSSALVQTSVEAGGVEAQYRLVMVSGQAWYDVADSITEILTATLLTEDGKTHSVKAYQPQWFGDTDSPPELGEDLDEDQFPYGYHYWADTLQVFPIPKRVDTLILKCFVEHRAISADTNAVQLQPAYTLACVDLVAYMVMASVDEFEKAGFWLAAYERKRDALRGIYRRKFDIISSTKE